MTRLKVTYRKNLDYREGSEVEPQLYATLDLSDLGVNVVIADLPIYFRRLSIPVGPILQVYATNVAGLPLEKGNLNSLETALDLYLDALIHFGRLPEYLFQVGENAWPIYRLDEQLVTRYPGSPFFSGETIGELRVVLADYFKLTGEIRNRKELGILALSRSDLQLYEPACMLRAVDLADIPVFPLKSKEGEEILAAPVNAKSIETPLAGGDGFMVIHHLVEAYLRKQGKLRPGESLTMRKLSPEVWAVLAEGLGGDGRYLTYYDNTQSRSDRQRIDLFRNGKGLIAARTNRLGRVTLYTAPTVRRLQETVGAELSAAGKVGSPGYVTVRKEKEADPFGQKRTSLFEDTRLKTMVREAVR